MAAVMQGGYVKFLCRLAAHCCVALLVCLAVLPPSRAEAADRAAVLKAATEKAAHWKDAWSPFYKNESRGADFALLKFVPHRLEIVSESHGLVSEKGNWRPVSIDFPAKAP